MRPDEYSMDDRHLATAELDGDADVIARLHALLRRPARESRVLTCLDIATAARLDPGPRRGDEQLYRCPRHDDAHPSLSINVKRDVWMCGPCGAKGTAWQLAAFLAGVNPSDKPTVVRWLTEHGLEPGKANHNAVKPNGNHNGRRRVVATFDYTDENGHLLYQIQRWEPGRGSRKKDFTVRRPDGSGGWIDGIGDTRRVLYRLPELLIADTVYIVEGEGKADELRTLGLTATCSPFGANKWRPEYAAFFRPQQRIVIQPDNDEPGQRHGQQVAGSLHGRVASLKILELPGVPEKGDVSDWLAAGGTREGLETLAAKAPEFVDETDQGTTARPVLVRLSDIQPEEVHWIWPARIAQGKLSLLIGDPENGKSTALIDVASRITRGAEWPDGGRAEMGNVIVLTAEDGLADTVRPRVDLHGGDASRIHIFKAIKEGEDERPVSLVTDLPQLEAAIRALQDVRLIIVDPLSAYLGDRDTYKDSEIRSVLSPLAALAERHKVAIASIVHLSKGEPRKALYRALGSVAFVAAARTVFAVGRDPGNPDRRIFVCVKNNLATHPPALAFSFIEQGGRGVLRWEEQPVVGFDADSVLSTSLNAGEREEHQDGEEFLRELLADGQVAANDVFQAGRQNGFSEASLKRAKSRLGIRAVKVGQPGKKGKWYWNLSPKGITDSPKGIISASVIPFEQAKDVTAVSSVSSSKRITGTEMIPFGDPPREEFDV